MKDFFVRINNQDGSMILIAMMLIVILTIMGITSTTTSVVENRIAVNEQLHKMSFFHADSGIYATPKVIRAIMREGDDVSAPDMDGSIYYLLFDDDDDQLIQSDDGEHFFDQIMGYQGYDDGTADIGYEVAVGGVDREVRVDVKGSAPFMLPAAGLNLLPAQMVSVQAGARCDTVFFQWEASLGGEVPAASTPGIVMFRPFRAVYRRNQKIQRDCL